MSDTVPDAAPEALPAGVRHLRCDNPGPMTLTGTNTYVVSLAGPRAQQAIPGHSDASRSDAETPADVAVIDPGPALRPEHSGHLEAVVKAVRDVVTAPADVAVLLTHHHGDHTGGIDDVVDALRAAGHRVSIHGAGRPLPSVIGALRVVPTPGHTADSVCFLLPHERVLFSGDTVLGGSSSFIAHPDGDLTDYLASLDRLLAALPADATALLAPGHGTVGGDARGTLEEYRAHRRERLEQVQAVLDEFGPQADVDDVVNAVYADIGPQLRPAVEAVVRAQLKHLRE